MIDNAEWFTRVNTVTTIRYQTWNQSWWLCIALASRAVVGDVQTVNTRAIFLSAFDDAPKMIISYYGAATKEWRDLDITSSILDNEELAQSNQSSIKTIQSNISSINSSISSLSSRLNDAEIDIVNESNQTINVQIGSKKTYSFSYTNICLIFIGRDRCSGLYFCDNWNNLIAISTTIPDSDIEISINNKVVTINNISGKAYSVIIYKNYDMISK